MYLHLCKNIGGKFMNLKDIKVEELELMSYTDLTYLILKEEKKPMNTPTIFKKICDLLEYSDEEYASKIGDYYTSLTIDKRFVLLDNNEWDVRDHHSINVMVDEEEMEDIEEIEEAEEEEETEEENEDYSDDIVDNLDGDDVEEDIEDLAILDEDELEE